MRFHLRIVPPKATHQGSAMILHSKAGKPFVGRPSNSPGAKAKKSLVQLMMEHAPNKPLEGPLKVFVSIFWPWRASEPKYRKALKCVPMDKKPDLDNYAKLILDSLQDARFFAVGDSQIYSLTLTKHWSDEPGIIITIEEE